jgi:hypothetical protein
MFLVLVLPLLGVLFFTPDIHVQTGGFKAFFPKPRTRLSRLFWKISLTALFSTRIFPPSRPLLIFKVYFHFS